MRNLQSLRFLAIAAMLGSSAMPTDPMVPEFNRVARDRSPRPDPPVTKPINGKPWGRKKSAARQAYHKARGK